MDAHSARPIRRSQQWWDVYCDDKEEVLKYIQEWHPSVCRFQNIFPLDKASDRLRDDTDVVLAAIKKDFHPWPFSSLAYASGRLKNDRAFVMAAVTHCGYTLCDASSTHIDDAEVVLAAVGQSGRSIRFASNRLRKDIDVIRAALTEDYETFRYIDFDHLTNREDAKAIIERCPYALCRFPSEFRNDQEIVLEAITNDFSCLEIASKYRQRDPTVVLKILHLRQYNRKPRLFREIIGRLQDLNDKLVAQNDGLLACITHDRRREAPETTRISLPPISAGKWLRSQWERIWLIGRLYHNNEWDVSDIQRHVVEYTGTNKLLMLFDEIIECEPVINRFIELQLTPLEID
jgi:Domain of unknown function (DUF4116)